MDMNVGKGLARLRRMTVAELRATSYGRVGQSRHRLPPWREVEGRSCPAGSRCRGDPALSEDTRRKRLVHSGPSGPCFQCGQRSPSQETGEVSQAQPGWLERERRSPPEGTQVPLPTQDG